MKYFLTVVLLCINFTAIAQEPSEEQKIASTLDSFHQAAASANADKYLSFLSEDAIFLGTDANERWNKKQFSEFVLPYFNQGKGWLYVPVERNISMLEGESAAFFDEVLFNKKYGHCRGSGVLVKTKQGWQINQYNLTFLVPNGVAMQVTEKIKQYESNKATDEQ